MENKSYLNSLVGVFGHPVSENPGVVIQEAAFRDLGLDLWRFLTIDIEPKDIGKAIESLKVFNMRGINCTIPHKISAIKYLDNLTESARLIGAINIIINNNGVLTGDNTDGKGFMMSMEENQMDTAGKEIVILGSGGAARAISIELCLSEAKAITIVNRIEDKEIGQKLYNTLNELGLSKIRYIDWTDTFNVPDTTDILINATPVGLYPDTLDCPNINYDTILKNMFVQDVIPNPIMTEFLIKAKGKGARICTGAAMLINQASLNIEMWTGLKPNKKVMMDALNSSI